MLEMLRKVTVDRSCCLIITENIAFGDGIRIHVFNIFIVNTISSIVGGDFEVFAYMLRNLVRKIWRGGLSALPVYTPFGTVEGLVCFPSKTRKTLFLALSLNACA